LAGIVLSRFGLWSFDLCAQILIQDSVQPSYRGSFSATEASLQNFFELCAFAMTIAFPSPQQFRYPALISLLAIYCSAAIYTNFVRERRGHLLHMPVCLKHMHDREEHQYELVTAEVA
jgi:iron-regulated transporter 1